MERKEQEMAGIRNSEAYRKKQVKEIIYGLGTVLSGVGAILIAVSRLRRDNG